MTRMSESAAPKLGIVDTLVSMELDLPANANGVLYAVGGFGGGLTLYVKDGVLNYEYNQFEVSAHEDPVQRQAPDRQGEARGRIEAGRQGRRADGHHPEGEWRNGVGQGRVPTAISLHFTTNESFDIGSDTDSPVSLAYFDQAPFAFNGTIGTTKVTYPEKTRRTRGNKDQPDERMRCAIAWSHFRRFGRCSVRRWRPARLRTARCCPSRRPHRPASPLRPCRNPSTSAGSSRASAARCAEHPDHPARRRGLRPRGHLRRARSIRRRSARSRARAISYNAFHTTAICSPTRAALLTGRNHQRVGSGTIAERAVDWDGYTGVIPEDVRDAGRGAAATTATRRAAFGKWHNTPADQTDGHGALRSLADGSRLRLLLRLPRRRDLAVGAAAGREHRPVEPPHDEKYHLTEDMADTAIDWMRKHRAFAPDKPFFMYWAPGAGARTAPRRQGLGGQVQGQVRRRLGSPPRANLRTAEGARLDPGGHQAHAARRRPWPPGTASRRPSAPSSSA